MSESMYQPGAAGFPLSPQQLHLWNLLRESGRESFQAVCEVLLEGSLDPARLRSALGRVVERHEILRTTFRCLPGMTFPLQMIGDAVLSWDGEPGGAPGADGEPPLRAVLTEASPGRHLLRLSLPALCADHRTLVNLLAAIGDALAGSPSGEAMQYADVSAWQNEILDSEETAEAREFWSRQEIAPKLSARLPFERAGRESFRPRSGAEIELAHLPGMPPAAFALACWQVLIARLSGEPELVVCARSEGRDFEELQATLGPLEKYLPIACRLEGWERFSQVVRRAARALEQARAHQNAFSWERLAEWSGLLESTLSPALAFEAEDQPLSREAAGLRLWLCRAEACTERFALKLRCRLQRDGGPLQARIDYDASRFRPEDVERLTEYLQALARSAAAAPESPVFELGLLSEAEHRREVLERNQTRVEFPRRCLHRLVWEQAERTPGRVAVRFEEGGLTYSELCAAAAHLAHRLRSLGVGPDTPVAIHAERSLEMVAGLLAILSAGGAYVPLDPDHPVERVAAILNDIAPRAVLTSRQLADRLPQRETPVIPLEIGSAKEAGAEWSWSDGMEVDPEHLAYILFTSGSTGQPKGVMVPHRAIVNRLLWMQRELPLSSSDRVLQKTPYGFDASIWEIFCPLLAGAELVLARPSGHQDSAYLARAAAEQGITVLQLVPSQLRAFLNEPDVAACTSLRGVFCGGEELPVELHDRLSRLSRATLHNLYGPTEVAIDATFWICREPAEGKGVPIGHPIANAQVYLLGLGGAPVPSGMAGELYVGGAGVSRGYWGRPDLTAERFVPDPFGGPGDRLYRTGDLARRRPGGEIEYLGRVDRQVKIRGVRIEPREVEALLASCPGVRQAVVVAVAEEQGAHLSAYVVPDEEGAPSVADLRRRLSEVLPAAMIPSVVAVVRSLPLTPNGKLDLRALEEAALASAQAERESTFVGPRTPTEEVLADLWADVLGIERLGVHESFFDLGGHSLRATQLISRVRRVFRVEVPVRDLFEKPTVAALAAHLDRLLRGWDGAAPPPLVPVPRDGRMPLSFAQQRLFFLHQLQPGGSFYNIPTAIRFIGRLNVAVLERTLDEIARRHEALRTVFHEEEDGEPVQVIEEPRPVRLPVLDLSGLVAKLADAEAERLIREEIARPFDLGSGPLFRAVLLRLAESSHIGVLTMHHIASDGWSTAVLVREVAALYPAFAEGRPSPLPELPIQYADFAHWQRQWLQGRILEEQITWWRNRLAGAPPVLEVPTDRPRPEAQTFRGASEVRVLDVDLGPALQGLAKREGATLFMLLVAAGAVLLRWWSGQEDVVVGTDVANRNREETEGLIGFFINQLALRTRLTGDPDFREVLGQVREATLGAYAHEDLPFDKLVLALNPERSRKHAPLFQVKINLHNIPTAELELPGLRLEAVRLVRDTAQFDLILNFMENPPGMIVSADYATDLFEGRTIARQLKNLETLLATVAERPDARLDELCEVLSKVDRDQRRAEREERHEARARTLKRVRREAVSVALGGEDADS